MPKSPHTPLKPVMAPPPKLATPPPVATAAPTTARRDNGSVADAGPVAESGGLAEGIAAPRLPSPAGNEVHAPALGAISAVQSKYYPGQVVDPTSGTHYDSTTGQPRDVPTAKREPEIEVVWDTPALSTATLVMRYLAVFAGILVVAGLLGYAFKGYYVATLLVCLFVAGLLMPIMEAVPKQRDDSDDVWIFAGLIMIFGPTIGLIIYSVFGLLRQSANPAVVGCFIVSILLQAVLFFTASPTLLLFGPPWVQGHGFDLRTLFINWSAFAALAGWYSANLFHKFDE